jgi:PAS domain S-box-containing protein
MKHRDQSAGHEKELAVLLIEDDLVDQMAFIRQMREQSEHYKIEVAGSISAARVLLEKIPVDIIISDFYLGDGTPLDILHDIIARKIPIIVVTSVEDHDAATYAKKCGIDDFLVKDQNYNYLKALPLIIERTLRSHNDRNSSPASQAVSDFPFQVPESGSADNVKDIHVRRLIIDHTELIARYRPDGTILFVNDMFCRYFKKTRGELIGKQFDLLLQPEERDLLKGYRDALTPENSQITLEHRVLLPGDRLHWIRRTERALFDESGQIFEYQTAGTDITDRKQAEDALQESEERYRMLAEYAFDGIAILDLSGTILYVNQSIVQMLGYSHSGEILGKNIVSFIAPKHREAIISDLHNVQNGKQGYLQKYRAVKSDSTEFCIESVGTQITFRGKPAYIIALRDVDERECAISRLHCEISRKKDFINVASHELRTPLQPIIGYLEMLIDDPEGFHVPPEVLGILKKIRTFVESERHIVNQILELSLLENIQDIFKPSLESVQVKELVNRVIVQGSYAKEAAISILVPDSVTIPSNNAYVHEIMDDLLSNAVKFSHPPRQITIFSEETDTEFRLSVTDNGVGILPEKWEVVFEPFIISDGEKLSRKYGRLGLGLPMARKRAIMLGGTLTLTSSSEAGSTFTLSLPRQEPLKPEL